MRLLLAAVTVAGLAACGGTSTSFPKADRPPPSTVPKPVAATVPVPVTESIGSQISAWWDGNSATMQAIVDDANAVSTDANAGDVASVTTDCQTLLDDVNRVDPSGLPPGIRAAIRSGMDHFATSAQACLDGDYATAASEADAASVDMTDATAQIHDLG